MPGQWLEGAIVTALTAKANKPDNASWRQRKAVGRLTLHVSVG
jgi:hypothetical protein